MKFSFEAELTKTNVDNERAGRMGQHQKLAQISFIFNLRVQKQNIKLLQSWILFCFILFFVFEP
jgi:hypothetical protein